MNMFERDELPADDLNHAKTLLIQGGFTLVLCKADSVITDTRRGIRPLLELLEKGTAVADFCAADKVIGKAAAFLYRLLSIRSVYAQVISEPALQVLREGGIAVAYNQIVPAIRNRTNTGFCPMETAVWDAADPQDALCRIQDALQALST